MAETEQTRAPVARRIILEEKQEPTSSPGLRTEDARKVDASGEPSQPQHDAEGEKADNDGISTVLKVK
jgi:hypothetical protein